MSCSAAYILVINWYFFISNYLSAAGTPEYLGALLSSNNYWYVWEKLKVISSFLGGLWEELRMGFCIIQHKASHGCIWMQTCIRGIKRWMVRFLGVGLCRLSRWKSDIYKLNLCGLFCFIICFGLPFIQRSLKPSRRSRKALSWALRLAMGTWKWGTHLTKHCLSPSWSIGSLHVLQQALHLPVLCRRQQSNAVALPHVADNMMLWFVPRHRKGQKNAILVHGFL